MKLPSRNWLIFLSITGAWVSALTYDRYHKKRVQKKWCHFVSHLAEEPLPDRTMPRKITIFLEAPPGDSLRPAREHFHEYIKPILVAGAVDWEVIEGRREGEVRTGLAEKIRKMRERQGEKLPNENEEPGEQDHDLVLEMRERAGIHDWDGVQGDLVIGRHTWKEYIRGLHEGWLGPLKKSEPAPKSESSLTEEVLPATNTDLTESTIQDPGETNKAPEEPKPTDKPSPPSLVPAYISTASYPTSPAAPTLPDTFPPSTLLELPHLLGMKHTPTRLYRFLNRRYLADSTGAQVAALVFASHYRPYSNADSFVSAVDPDEASPSLPPPEGNVVRTNQAWEQATLLQDEERGWHKSAWTPPKEGEEEKERIWTSDIIVDDRIGTRMRLFELEEGAAQEAASMEEASRSKEPSSLERVKTWIGWGNRERKGWEMGEEGDEYS